MKDNDVETFNDFNNTYVKALVASKEGTQIGE